MTHSIGTGMLNVSLPLPEREVQMTGRLAFRLNKSRVALYRECALEGMRVMFPDFAREIARVRAEHQAHKAAAAEALRCQQERQQYFKFFPALTCLLVGAMAVVGTLLTGDDQLRRSKSFRVRTSWARRVEA